MLSTTQIFKPAAILWLCCLFVSSPNLAEESPDETALQPGYGYLLLRIIVTGDQRVAKFEMTNLDTGDVIRTNSDMYRSAGRSAWMCLVTMPGGRYFWSKYEPDYRIGLEQSRNVDRPFGQNAPSSASDTFEIVAGVINYVGDWTIRITQGVLSREWSVKVNPNVKTLERLVDRYPEYTDRYGIYLSMMGKKAISLLEFQKIVEEHSDPMID